MEMRSRQPQNIMKIREVELGKPDARDEVLYVESLEEFCDRIILPPNFIVDNILSRDKFYIVGNKGVGKTALLFYIHYLLKQKYPSAVCSMILFKNDITNAQRARMDKIENIHLNAMDIPEHALKYVKDFTRLWRLVIYKKIVKDNMDFEVFEKDTNWDAFVDLIKRLDENESEVLEFTTTIPKNNIYYNHEQATYVSERVEYPDEESELSLKRFYHAIEQADKLFCSLVCKASKYYICIDELEAYHSIKDIYIRDLTMIRDLIIETKRMNNMLKANGINNIKVILSVRTEVVNSISRELPGFEFNKDLGGFAERINWAGARLDFWLHPLLSIWIKRIQRTLSKNELSYTPNDIFFHMFDSRVGMERIEDYVLERSWNKPRDIIRFMRCINELAVEGQYRYDAKSFANCMDEYSRQSRIELVEEMEAIYTSLQVEKIFACLTAYKKSFTKEELYQRLDKTFLKSWSEYDLDEIISDLYRMGIVGIRNIKTGKELWGYLGQTYVEGDEWRFLVHRGLWRNLELENAAYEGVLCVDIEGTMYNCKVEAREKNYLKLSFLYREQHLFGEIHASNITRSHVELDDYIGQSIQAYVVGYNTNRCTWMMSCFPQKIIS